jgi:hypothetical protein
MPVNHACVNVQVRELDDRALVYPSRASEAHRVHAQVLVSIGRHYPQSTVLTFNMEMHGRNSRAIDP